MTESKQPWFQLRTGTIISKEDFQKTSYPRSLISMWPGVGAGFTCISMAIGNTYLNRPVAAGSHRMLLAGTLAYWTLYKIEEIHSRYFLGKYKHGLDYLLNCEDNSSRFTAPKKFSDPDYLLPWTPIRQGRSASQPVTNLQV